MSAIPTPKRTSSTAPTPPRCSGWATRGHDDDRSGCSWLTVRRHTEVRASGRRNDTDQDNGKHDISPVAVQTDHAWLPVTMPRNSDSDMCRERPSIASMQSDTGFDEHGRLRGVSDLNRYFADQPTLASNSWSFSAKERKRRWRILAQKRSQIRWRDKSSAVVHAAGGWFCWAIGDGTWAGSAALSWKRRLFSAILATALNLGWYVCWTNRLNSEVPRRSLELWYMRMVSSLSDFGAAA